MSDLTERAKAYKRALEITGSAYGSSLIANLLAALVAAEERIEKALEIHQFEVVPDGPDNSFPGCAYCKQNWPCPTVAALSVPVDEGNE